MYKKYFEIIYSSSFKLRNNPLFSNKVNFRRGVSARDTSPTVLNNINTKSNTSSTVAAMRSCIDTLSETASITPPASILLPHEGGSLSGKFFI